MKQCHIKDKWQTFINLPVEQQILERAATFVAQWCQPWKRVPYSDIIAMLDRIAQRVMQFLKEQHPTHPILSMPEEQFLSWKNNNINDNQWDRIEGRQIINAICTVIFQELEFHVDSEVLHHIGVLPQPMSFIDCVS